MAKVKIQGHASGTGVLTVTAPNTSTDRTITLPDGDVTLGAATPSIDDNGDATAITINSSEQVGIGQTNPSYTLDVYKSAVGNVARFNSSSGNRSLDITSADNGSYLGAVWKRDINSAGGTHIWSTNGTERLRIQQAGGISFNGDTAAANALDDYEEGTWTPNFVASGLSVSYNVQVGKYTKIGSAVICTLKTNTSDISGDGTNNTLTITGLPFTPVAHSGGFAFGGTYGFDEAPAAAEFSGSTIYLIDPSGNYSVANDLSDGNDKNHTLSSFVFTTDS